MNGWRDSRAGYAQYLIHTMPVGLRNDYLQWYTYNFANNPITELDPEDFSRVLNYLECALGLSDAASEAIYLLTNNLYDPE